MAMRAKEVLVASGCILALVVMVASPFLLFVGGWLAESMWFDYKNRSEFHRHRPDLEAIVRKLDRELVEPKSRGTYAFAELVKVVRPMVVGESEAKTHPEWSVRAERLADGHLRVEICTFHRGHLGVWSLNYLSRFRAREELQKDEWPWSATPLDGLWWSAVFSD